jgi:hypothetical protein
MGETMSSISPVIPGRLNSGLNLRNELFDGLFAFEHDALPLIDFRESLLGRLPERFQLRLPFLFLFFQQPQRLADDFAGVAVAPRRNLTFNEMIEVIGQVDIACGHDRFLGCILASLAGFANENWPEEQTVNGARVPSVAVRRRKASMRRLLTWRLAKP